MTTKTIAYCGGTFDCLHPGHLHMLKWAKESFGTVIVALNTDEFIKRYKLASPIFNFENRETMLKACRYVDEVIENVGDEDSRPSILSVHPTHVVNGADWTRERLMKQMNLSEEFLKENNITISLCPTSFPIHTTDIKLEILRKAL